MFKKRILFLSIFILSGCSGLGANYEGEKLSFEYPSDMSVSVDEFDPFGDYSKIYVETMNKTDFIKPCIASNKYYAEIMDRSFDELENEKKYFDILNAIKDGYITEDLEIFNNHCQPVRGVFNLEQIKVDGLNGIRFEKAYVQEIGSMSGFYTQVVFIDDNDMVYGITYPYGTGSYKRYVESIVNEYGEAFPSSDASDIWYDAYYYLKYGSNINYQKNESLIEAKNSITRSIGSISLQ